MSSRTPSVFSRVLPRATAVATATPPKQPSFLVLLWGATLLASNLPAILWQQGTHTAVPLWLIAGQIGLLLVLTCLTIGVRSLRPFSGYVVTLLVVASAFLVYVPLSRTSLWHVLDAHATWLQDSLLRQVPTTLGALVLAATLIGSGLTRRELAFRGSEWDATAARDPVILNFFRRPWRRAGIWYAVIITGLLATIFFRHTVLPVDAGQRWLHSLPAILLIAGVNTISEEFQYRQVPLARLRGVVSVRQSLWLTALLFGISHFYGNPSGVLGVIAATWFGYLQAKSITESKGSTWAWLIHFTQDLVIFSSIAL